MFCRVLLFTLILVKRAPYASIQVLLLDEPSSGCDSRTRELIRQEILSRKRSCAVLLSTHHLDDVEVLSDERLWFLDERYLVYDGEVSGVETSQGLSAGLSAGDVEFSTSQPAVASLFMQRFGDHEAQLWKDRAGWGEHGQYLQEQNGAGDGVRAI